MPHITKSDERKIVIAIEKILRQLGYEGFMHQTRLWERSSMAYVKFKPLIEIAEKSGLVENVWNDRAKQLGYNLNDKRMLKRIWCLTVKGLEFLREFEKARKLMDL